MKLADRLREAREAAGYSQEELAKKIGVVQQSLHKIEAGIIQNPRKLPLIESILGLPAGYLRYGDNNKSSVPHLPQPMIARCPMLSWEQAIEWPKNKDEVLKDKDLANLAQKIILSGNCYSLQINDTSMTDTGRRQSFNEGSFIVVDPDIEYKSGNLVIAVEDSIQPLFRRYVKEASREYLFAYNSQYEPIKIDKNIKICGVVVAHLSIFS